jgi:hypothetical protein
MAKSDAPTEKQMFILDVSGLDAEIDTHTNELKIEVPVNSDVEWRDTLIDICKEVDPDTSEWLFDRLMGTIQRHQVTKILSDRVKY